MLYRLARLIATVYMVLFHRISFVGRENIPAEGPVLIYANHPSAFDMFLIAARIKRKVHFMAKAELFANPFLAYIFRGLGAFPVHRGKGDAGSVKSAISLLKQGQVVGIFPEGTRTRKKAPERRKGGAALIAYHTDAPILPVALDGHYHIFCKMRIVYGKPFHLQKPISGKPDREALYAATSDIIDRIYALIGQ
jgi:1-acyl-sn-glycerol-3-phosphate acyltransferase